MDLRVTFCTIALCLIIAYWCYRDSELVIDYKRNHQLVDPKTGFKYKPKDVYDLTKVINVSQSYIDSTNAQQRLYDLKYNLEFENPFIIDQTYSDKYQLEVSGGPVVDQAKCGQQLRWILDGLRGTNDYTAAVGQLGYELTMLMDSFGRLGAGAYSGIFDWMGSYQQCLKTTLNRGNIKTRYCIAHMRPNWWPKNLIDTKSAFRVGMCLPETCDTLSFNLHKQLIERLVKHEMINFHEQTFKFESMFCLPDERSPIRLLPDSGRYYLIAISTWLMLVVVSTIIYEYNLRRKKLASKQSVFDQVGCKSTSSHSLSTAKFLEQVVESLSVRISVKTFKSNTFNTNYRQIGRVKVDLGFLNMVRVTATILVIMAHSAYMASIFARSLSNKIDMGTHDLARLALSIGRCVDLFFLFFGVLTAYNILKKFRHDQLGNPLMWISVNLAILIRTTPVFMFIYWYSKSVSPYTGSGPWWDYGVDHNSLKGYCMQTSWWQSIPLLSSLGTTSTPSCVLPGWFLVSYSQISLIVPAIIYIIYKMPSHTIRALLVLFIVSCSATQLGVKLHRQTSIKEEGLSIYGSFLVNLLEKFESTGHMSTLGRLGTVAIGSLVGYWLYQYEIGVIKNWPRILRSGAFITFIFFLHVLILILPVLGGKITQWTGATTTMNEFIAINIILLVSWPIMNSILIIYCATVVNHKVVMRFFSHPFWNTFNKLGLSIFLIHWEIMFVCYTNFEQAPTFGFKTDVIKMWAFGTVWSIMISVLIYILIEAPLLALFIRFIKPLFEPRKQQNVELIKPKIIITDHCNNRAELVC